MEAFNRKVPLAQVLGYEVLIRFSFLIGYASSKNAFKDFMRTVLYPLSGSGLAGWASDEALLESLGCTILGILNPIERSFDGAFEEIDCRSTVEGEPVPRLDIEL